MVPRYCWPVLTTVATEIVFELIRLTVLALFVVVGQIRNFGETSVIIIYILIIVYKIDNRVGCAAVAVFPESKQPPLPHWHTPFYYYCTTTSTTVGCSLCYHSLSWLHHNPYTYIRVIVIASLSSSFPHECSDSSNTQSSPSFSYYI